MLGVKLQFSSLSNGYKTTRTKGSGFPCGILLKLNAACKQLPLKWIEILTVSSRYNRHPWLGQSQPLHSMKKTMQWSSNSKLMGKSLQDSALCEIIYSRQLVISTQLFMWAIEQKVPVKMYLDTKMLLLSLKKTTLLSYTNEQIEPDAFALIWIYKSSSLFTRVPEETLNMNTPAFIYHGGRIKMEKYGQCL